MSDDRAAPDPMDKAYVQAEAVLADEAARAARRARVLEAVAREAADAPTPVPALRRSAWRHGGWLAAACVAGLSVLMVTQVYRPTEIPPPAKPVAPAARAPAVPAAPATTSAPAPAPPIRAPSSRPPAPLREAPAAALRAAEPAPAAEAKPADQLTAPPPAPPPPSPMPAPPPPRAAFAPAPPPPPPAAAGASSSNTLEEMVVVTGEKRTQASAKAARVASPATPPSEGAARLRAAAADGRTAEVEALLARGVAVDAPDADGETALMKSIRGDHAEVAALLRRHGASLDHRNHAGVSAKDLAASMADPDLNRALGIEP